MCPASWRGPACIALFSMSFASGCFFAETSGSSPDPVLLALALTAQTQPDRIVLWNSAPVSGALGGRSGADSRCQLTIPSGLTCRQSHAVLSVDVADTIAEMYSTFRVPLEVPVTSQTSETIAASWNALTFSDLTAPLSVVTGGDPYWTGAISGGQLHPTDHCSNWTTSALAFGAVGEPASLTNPWQSPIPVDCFNATPLLCACW